MWRPWRSPLSLVLATCVAASQFPSAARAATNSAAPEASPEQLYDEGRKAYRLGDFETAVDKWQQAYDLSDNGLLLYNISLAYKGLYTISGDTGDLRRSRAVLDNFIKVAHADPDIEEDDAPQRLAELDKMIAEAEAAEEANKPPPPVVVTPDDGVKDDRGPDPGRKLRLAGMGTMIGGGAIALTGVSLAAFYAIKGQEFASSLKRDNNDFETSGCDALIGDQGETGERCRQLDENRDTWRANGQQANVLAVAMGVGLGGVGVVALIAGGLVFNESNKRTKQWERGLTRVQVAPTFGSVRGLTISGRF